MVEDIKCLAPLGKIDYIGLSFKLVTLAIKKINEHETSRLNEHSHDYNKMKLLFKMAQWAIVYYSNMSHYRMCGGYLLQIMIT